MKTPLTVDIIVKLLNQQQYTIDNFDVNSINKNRVSLNDFNKVFSIIINYFFESYKIFNIEIIDDLEYPNNIILNDKMKNHWHTNISKISFNNLYPNIISKLWKNNELKFNINEFAIIYSFMVENIDEIKNHKDMNEVSKLLFNFLIYYTYGALTTTLSKFYVDDHYQIKKYTNLLFRNFIKNYNDNIIYIDTDIIYLDFLNKNIKYELNQLEIPYEIEFGINGIFFDKKKFILDSSNTCKVKGYRKFKSKYQLLKNRISKIKVLNSFS